MNLERQGEGTAMAEGREGDWECSSCNNRNYAFRSFCNRCKQPRLLVDAKTPADSKWLPRAGDWICTGCTNNNYASREKCKKCGQPKEVAALPAIAMAGASLPTYSHYFARVQEVLGRKMEVGAMGSGDLQEVPLNSSAREFDNYGAQSPRLLGGNLNAGLPFPNPFNQLPPGLKGWRNGDWICRCGFHNYSSRTQCKKCNAFMSTMPSALGMKRLASENLIDEWDNKRLNARMTTIDQQSYRGFEQVSGGSFVPRNGDYASLPVADSVVASNMQVQTSCQAAASLPGKGATQWRDGDWMCTNCNNHNYKSRKECNRCKTQKPDLPQPVADP
ncbi:uncharacterized RNA-binding protein C17H9.04c [Punica granatum]|uniref:Uncharacterized RNA-binding protein C17H9.04c n=1 Tax=Punica granatum TaxID=22663 RepID=A0A6P8DD90_PUNGR|nr:uncharacterized RNA-binding protein C17H9.04c [Punica granatum]